MKKILLLTAGIVWGLSLMGILVSGARGVGESGGQAEITGTIRLPCRVPGTALIAQRILLYEGGYLEDRSNREVVDITALELKNAGTQMIRSAQVILEKNGYPFVFQASFIPPGSSVIVLEAHRLRGAYPDYTALRGTQRLSDELWLPADRITLSYPDMGCLALKNSGAALENITVYYKNYLPYSHMYVGGVTGSISVDRLGPGETRRLFPPYYAKDYTKILGITAKESPDVP